jgi:para-aminobenzoate synthetase component 1
MMSIGFYDVLLAFDRGAQRSWVIATGRPERALSAREARATFRIEAMLRRLAEPAPALPAAPPLQWQAERSPAEHQAAVARAQAYIRDGDIFQANITMRHLAARPRETHPASLYATLRAANRTPFSAYLDCGPTLAIASVSPERFLRLYAGGTIETRPIKGTRRRDAGAMTDMYLRQALAESGKDRAENLMITDLMRNDIGRVAEIGSVRVPELQKVETFATVHHMVSVVEAQLRRGCTAVDLLRATFPGGSITGAPKIRAMEIIDELEASRRGPYCGSIVWLGHDGAMDSSILIRTLVITPELIAAQAGGGIVAESDPREEWEEVMTKIRPLLQAFGP